MPLKTRDLALVLTAVLLFGVLIWPGQWRYGTFSGIPMRTHRITGRTQLFAGQEWISKSSRSAEASRDTVRMLTSFEQSFVTGRGGVDGTGYFNGSLYNGSECNIRRVVYSVTTSRDGIEATRAFSQPEFIQSRQTEDVIFQADIMDSRRKFERWHIDSVEANCPKASGR